MPFPRRPESHAARSSTLVPAAFLLAAFTFLPAALHAQSTSQPATIPAQAPTSVVSTSAPTQPPDQSPDQDADGLPSFHALPSTLDSAQLDGIDLTQSFNSVPAGSGADPDPDPAEDSDSAELLTGPSHGLARGRHAGAAYLFAPSSIREFRVTGSAYTATSSGAGGTFTAVTTRAGASGFHGSAFFLLRSSAFAAHDPDALANTYTNGLATSTPVKPHDLRERFGGALGGPILPAHGLVFFYAFDAQRRGFPAISSPSDPNFFALTSIQAALLAIRGVTTPAVSAGLNYLASLTGPVDRRADQTIHFARIDWHQHPRLPLGFEVNRVTWSSPAGLTEAPVIARGRASLGNATGSVTSVLLRSDAAFTSHLLSQFHVAYVRDLQYETPETPLPQEPAVSAGGLAPEVNIAPNGFLFGTPATLSQTPQPDERGIELADTVTYTRGRNLLSIGGSVAFLHDSAAALTNSAGAFYYDSGATRGFQGGIVDFITDYTFNVDANPNGACPSVFSAIHLFCFQSFTQSFGAASAAQSIAFSTQHYTAFAQNDFRLRPRLTLQLGLRYEYTLLPIPTDPNPALDALFAARASTAIFPEDRNNLAPRASFAWQPRHTGFTFRAGYGVFYGRLPGATLRDALADTAQPTSTTRIRITPSTRGVCPTSANGAAQGFGYPCAFLAAPTGTIAQTTSAFVFDRHFRLPAIQQASFTIERSLPGRTIVSAGYQLNLDRQLPGSTDLNIAPSTATETYQLQGGTGAPGVRDGEIFTLPLYTARLTPFFGPVTDLNSHANGTYNALRLTAFTAPSRSFTVSAGYIWSKGLDDAPNLTATPRSSTQLDPYTNGYDKGLSSLNEPWSFHAQAVWSPLLSAHSRTLRRIANGFAFTPIVIARAGRPYSFDLAGGTALPGGHESINGSGGALYLPTVGRNTLRLPRTVTADLRASRAFVPTRRLHVEAIAEAFNLANTRNLAAVNQRAFNRQDPVAGIVPLLFQSAAAIATEGLNITPFGTPTAASTALARARQLQFELRVQF